MVGKRCSQQKMKVAGLFCPICIQSNLENNVTSTFHIDSPPVVEIIQHQQSIQDFSTLCFPILIAQ
jgi:hypothetical protein